MVISISLRRIRAYRPERKEPGSSEVERLEGGRERGREGRRKGVGVLCFVMSISFRRMRAYRPERKEPGSSEVERPEGRREGGRV